MKSRVRYLLVLMLLVGTIGLLSVNVGAGFARQVILRVESTECAWAGSNLNQMLATALTRRPQIRVLDLQTQQTQLPPFPADEQNVDSLVNWGKEIGGRYLLMVEVQSQRLERRKKWHIPLIFHKYSNVGVIEGELRLVDLTWGKQILAEPFKIQKEAKRIMQMSMDDNASDPELHMSASEKVRFFDELEKRLTKHILKRIDKVTGSQDG